MEKNKLVQEMLHNTYFHVNGNIPIKAADSEISIRNYCTMVVYVKELISNAVKFGR